MTATCATIQLWYAPWTLAQDGTASVYDSTLGHVDGERLHYLD